MTSLLDLVLVPNAQSLNDQNVVTLAVMLDGQMLASCWGTDRETAAMSLRARLPWLPWDGEHLGRYYVSKADHALLEKAYE